MFSLGYQIQLAIVVSALIALVMVPILRDPAFKMNLVDRPGGRKRHYGAVPLSGGLAIFVAFIFSAMMMGTSLQPYASLLVGMAVMLATGLLDDLVEISPGVKMAAQVLAALLMVSWGQVQITDLGMIVGVKPIELGEWAIPFTVLCVLVLINAINMIDGSDGLAGSLVAVMLVMFFTLTLMGGAERELSGIIALLLAAVLAFLVYNFRFRQSRQARAFLGDSGSLMLGYAVAWLAVYISQHPEGVGAPPIIIAWILLLPALDVLVLFIRRVMRGRSPFSADSEHLHHVLLRSGFSVRSTVLMLVVVTAGFGCFGIYAWQNEWPEYWLFAATFPVFCLHYLASIRAWRVVRVMRIVRQRLKRDG